MFNNLLHLLVLGICSVDSANILAVFPIPAPSHFVLGSGLARGLLEAGHDVTIIAPFSDQKLLHEYEHRYKEVVLTGFNERREEILEKLNLLGDSKEANTLYILSMIFELVLQLTSEVLHHQSVEKLMKSDQIFDVMILEELCTTSLKFLAVHYKAQLILFSSMGSNAGINGFVGNPTPISYVSDILLGYSSHMTFFQRVLNSLMFILQRVLFHFYGLPDHTEIAKEYFTEIDIDSWLDHVLYNVSIVLLNSHPSLNSPVPLVPNMVEIGGFHIQPPKQLPEDLKQFLDNAKDGVILFSMGTIWKSTDIPLVKINAILQTFSKLKQKVIWKFENDSLNRDLPPNVMIRKWLPQNDILAHENVKLFITHAGLLSTTETIHHGVPVVAIPVSMDQNLNAHNIVNGGFGLSVPYGELNAENFAENVNEVLSNPKYAENAKRRSMIFHDRITTPMETAVYWVEYVIRHQGAPHLRVAGLDLPWYKYFLLDVVLFFVVFASVSLLIFHRIIRRLKNTFCGCSKNEKKIKKN